MSSKVCFVMMFSLLFSFIVLSACQYHIKNEKELNAKLAAAGKKLVVIDFFATWCGACKQISPQISKMSKSQKGVVFLKVDVDEAESIADKYKVTELPTFVFIKAGKKVAEFSGANEEHIKELIKKHK